MKLFLVSIAIAISIFVVGCGSLTPEQIAQRKHNEGETVQIHVTDKGIKSYVSGKTTEDKYLIYTTSGTYEITDSILNAQFNSSDIYGYIQKNKCYSVGIDRFSFRVGFLSLYENIVSAKETPCTQ